MTGDMLTKGILTIGNIIKNVANDDKDALALEPDVESSGKITRLMSKFIIAPNVVVDENLKYMDDKYFKDLVKTELVTFTGIVTQAFSVMAEIYGVSPKAIVNKMGRGSKSYIGDIKRVIELADGMEHFDYFSDLMDTTSLLPANESIVNEKISNMTHNSKMSNNNYIQKDVAAFINVYELQLQFNDVNGDSKAVTIPIIIYPNITYTNANTLIANMLDSDDDKRFLTRVDEYRSGAISLSDLIFATDLVKKYKDRKIKNENDIASYLNVKDKTTAISDLLHNKNSFSKNYNIYLFDINKKATIEKQIKGSIYKEKYKDKLTTALFAFSVSFVDTEKEEVIITIDDIPGFSVLGFNMLKKEKDNDIKDVMKELMNNRQPF